MSRLSRRLSKEPVQSLAQLALDRPFAALQNSVLALHALQAPFELSANDAAGGAPLRSAQT